MFVVALMALLSGASSVTLKDANGFTDEVKFSCPTNQIISRVQSEHSNEDEDRLWAFDCAYAPAGASLSDCAWSGYVNEMKETTVYQCHDGGVITGWQSTHDKNLEDRRTKYKCCKPKGYLTHTCHYTGYLNYFDEVLNYRVPDGTAITGVFSEFSSRNGDRRFIFNICALDLAA
ncbi:hypothetical protein RRG08_021962 [Elysia crispata]|uniref:Dermatopontin n=1 Tax=Elysia crispata TaxID=231223 RepID=A0AAE1ACM6_9GAST|nr:hypothetical protein RRG08_021962 [Elysia crispata]